MSVRVSTAPKGAGMERARRSAGPVIEALVERDLRLVTAESLTGGLASYLLVDEPDAGEVIAGSVVTYMTSEKRRVLAVNNSPVISASCAEQMAVGAARLFDVECALSFTGVAGPSTQEGQPVGTVFIGAVVGDRSRVLDGCFEGSPDDVRFSAITFGFDALLEMLREQR